MPRTRRRDKPSLRPYDMIIPQGQILAGSGESVGSTGGISTSSRAQAASVDNPIALTADTTNLNALVFSTTPTQAELNALRDELVTLIDAVIADNIEIRNKSIDVITLANSINDNMESFLTGISLNIS